MSHFKKRVMLIMTLIVSVCFIGLENSFVENKRTFNCTIERHYRHPVS
ncbi:hypothetical protein HMPREF9318_00283 [Streptococcus urinalis FB127-CNA-2]|uniref:Uncharacterized protein n=1 Tax=Streptococcus urinalis 2285-97 TaxID=764291 RepID=G5KFM3_9STRE|nr:hypothetical protein STRUR_1030 [Streptococcus urinalis 2285-97]EKS22085.1 hypothetical protein HMPREF9318_00283 [Streptococcus urinalis FB127-CNA-2]VEF31897.1 Uncharacterised protein [Streptococcus urinalis]